MASVDPFIHPLPKELQSNTEVRNYFEYLNRYLHDLWLRTGGGIDLVDKGFTSSNQGLSTVLLDLNRRIGSGDILTVDTDSFTVDTIEQFADEVES